MLKATNWATAIDTGLKQRVATGGLSEGDYSVITKLAKCKLVRLFTSSTFTGMSYYLLIVN